jgi:hypothetical protein
MSNPAAVNSPTPSTPLQPVSLDGNDASSTLSPADCRTLIKILQDVGTASPQASLHVGDRDRSLAAEVRVNGGRSESGREDEMRYSERLYNYGDETEEGYEDEDDSIDLSDADIEDYDNDDTIEDIMNLPGQTAPPAPPQDFSSLYPHDQATPQEVKDIKLRRAAIEEELKHDLRAQQNGNVAAMDDITCDYISAVDGYRDDTLQLSDDPEFQAVQKIQAEIGMSVIGDDEAASELEVCEMARPSQRKRTVTESTLVDRGL